MLGSCWIIPISSGGTATKRAKVMGIFRQKGSSQKPINRSNLHIAGFRAIGFPARRASWNGIACNFAVAKSLQQCPMV
jgi:hypothetical protein